MNDLFVDTAGWALIMDNSEPLHQDATAVYQAAIAGKRRIVTTNYVLTEVIALLTNRSRLPRTDLVQFIDALRVSPQIEIIHVNAELDAQA